MGSLILATEEEARESARSSFETATPLLGHPKMNSQPNTTHKSSQIPGASTALETAKEDKLKSQKNDQEPDKPLPSALAGSEAPEEKAGMAIEGSEDPLIGAAKGLGGKEGKRE